MKLCSCSTQLSMKFQFLIKGQIVKYNFFSCLNLSDVFIQLINVKMPIFVGFLTFMSRMDNFHTGTQLSFRA